MSALSPRPLPSAATLALVLALVPAVDAPQAQQPAAKPAPPAPKGEPVPSPGAILVKVDLGKFRPALAGTIITGQVRNGVFEPLPGADTPQLAPPDAPPPPPPPPPPVAADQRHLTPARFADIPGWTTDTLEDALPALARSCARIAKLPPDRVLGPGGVAGTAARWQAACKTLPQGKVRTEAARAWFEAKFNPYSVSGKDGRDGLFTGYYEASLRGSLTRTGPYTTPVYGPPTDIVRGDLGKFNKAWRGIKIAGLVIKGWLEPYPNRAAIAAGALAGRGLELFYTDDPIAAFFTDIQGSAQVVMTDGSVRRIGYAGQNGYGYFPVGRELVNRGALKRSEVSLQTIRAWMEANPAERQGLMNYNPSFVFFRWQEAAGATGAEGVVLTAGRSLAVDHRFMPYGAPVFLDAEAPGAPTGPRLQRLLVAQDTGGAIRGAVRGDLFWGAGREAEDQAGVMKSTGQYWLLIAK